MSLQGTPPPEFDVTVEVARGLIRRQFPELGELEITPLERGWDNAIFRLGSERLIRLPMREVGDLLLRSEQTWLPKLAGGLPLPVPLPTHRGVPDPDYPWHWSLVPYFEGEPADVSVLAADQAEVWADFLQRLHQPAPMDAPLMSQRGLPLQARMQDTEARLQRLAEAGHCVTSATLAAWKRGLNATPSSEHIWLHGDLHGQNILTRNGKLAAVLDWGDMTAGDRASDLSSVWMLFSDPGTREKFWLAYPEANADLRSRSLAWCISLAAIILETGMVDNPRHEALGRMAFANMAPDY